ncbi:hypothetical protein TVAG_079550 [Trichomonas vaginalis G3]|uniref:Uncharacterized protein n=1 Tax=Trichomonas vaginalis (strain ATCC PRA-98 / G3) TaxID=412133 RepID=A2EF87_TRIV3|nr:nuclear chaperone required for maturation and nuclear export of pre-60s ribosome subunits [Trichomonas vaginalis G3]EAY08697.1 hypothetical protein TVAG_079550 [Trichomonas vaginalis G3]KAI5492824.1 nuclear chaperone required for maturation and nuclear export of pre-60s ribosome subunits [Trichomonas vaginalis G3]|eukprot:XP_001320920.1 hypothetical protein [Trichomonas vaginalis G3]
MIMKTNGETEKKGRFSIIGIASGKVPQSLKKSSIYFKRDQYDQNEMKEVCKNVDDIVKNFELNNTRNCELYSKLDKYLDTKQFNYLLREITSVERKISQRVNHPWEKIEITIEPSGTASILKIDKKKIIAGKDLSLCLISSHP